MARLKPGVTRDQAQAEMESVMDGLRREQPDFNTGWTANVVPLREQLVGDVRLAVLVLFGAVGAVLLIACGNIGSLMLTRAAGRRRELAIRSAVGAGTGRLLTQLVCESLMLSAAGGVLGVLLAAWILSGAVVVGGDAAAHSAALAGLDRSERARLRRRSSRSSRPCCAAWRRRSGPPAGRWSRRFATARQALPGSGARTRRPPGVRDG